MCVSRICGGNPLHLGLTKREKHRIRMNERFGGRSMAHGSGNNDRIALFHIDGMSYGSYNALTSIRTPRININNINNNNIQIQEQNKSIYGSIQSEKIGSTRHQNQKFKLNVAAYLNNKNNNANLRKFSKRKTQHSMRLKSRTN